MGHSVVSVLVVLVVLGCVLVGWVLTGAYLPTAFGVLWVWDWVGVWLGLHY